MKERRQPRLVLQNSSTKSAMAKKAQAIWRGVLTAEVLRFPHRRSRVIKSLLETAKRLKDTSPETCIATQGQVIAIMSEEVAQSRRTAYAAMKAFEKRASLGGWLTHLSSLVCSSQPTLISLSGVGARLVSLKMTQRYRSQL